MPFSFSWLSTVSDLLPSADEFNETPRGIHISFPLNCGAWLGQATNEKVRLNYKPYHGQKNAFGKLIIHKLHEEEGNVNEIGSACIDTTASEDCYWLVREISE